MKTKTKGLSTAVILLCMVSIVLGARRMVLDPFTVTQNLVVTLDSSLPTTGASSVTGSMIGGERDSVLYGVSGTLGNTVSSIVTGGSWHLACQRGADCKGSLTYDGKDSSSNLNFDGLGSVDFTFNRTKSLAFSVQADLDTFYNITVYESGSSGAKFATSRVSVPAGASQQFVIPFTTFVSSTGMDFSNVGSLVFFAEGAADLDTSVSQFITFSNDVTGTVFKDCDGDGLKGSGESAFAGVNVTLYNSVSTLPISSALTNVFGFYSIPTVPGSYYLCASPDTGVPTLPANNCTSTFSITGVNDYPNNNFGFTSPVVLSIPSDRTVSCTSSTAPAVTGTATATGCATPTISFVDVVTGSPCFRTISRTWTAREGTFVQTGVQKITVIDSTAPTFATFPSDVTVQCTADTDPSSLGTPVATDSCSSATVSFFDSVSGSPCSRTITRNWNAADDCGNTARQVQTIRTTDTTAPTFTTFPSDVTVQCTADTNPSSLGTPVVTDSCSSATVSFSDSVSGSPCSRTITRNWQGQDSCGNSVRQVQTIRTTDTTAPTFTTFPSDVTVQCTADTNPSSLGTPVVTDSCSSATVSFFDSESGSPCFKTITRNWKGQDSCGNTINQAQTITSTDITAPTFTTFPSDVTVACGSNTNPSSLGTPVVTDSCSSATVSFFDSESGSPCFKTITRNWKGQDSCGNTINRAQTITSTDITAPTFTTFPSDVTVACGSNTDPSSLGTPVVTDSCSPATVSFFDSVSGSPCSRTITRNWQGQDSCGNSVRQVQTIRTTDTTAPTFTTFPSDVTVACGANTDPSSLGTPTGADSCTSAIVTFSDTTSPSCGSSLTRNWQVADECGNTQLRAQTITVQAPPPSPSPSPTGRPLGVSATATATPSPRPRPNIRIDASPPTLSEQSGLPFTFSVSRDGTTSVALSVVVLISGTADFNSDYSTSLTGANAGLNTFTIPVGSASSSFTFTPIDDLVRESDETISVQIQDSAAYVILSGGDLSVVTIIDNDATPIVSVRTDGVTSLTEGSGSTFVAVFDRSPSDSAFSLTFSLSGTAQLPGDFTVASGATSLSASQFRVDFAAGVSSASVAFPITNDGVPESNESIQVGIDLSASYDITTRFALFTIVDDDLDIPPVVSVVVTQPAGKALLENSTLSFVFEFRRDTSNLVNPLSISFTVGGSATFLSTASTDYTVVSGADTFSSTSGAITIPAGSSAKSIVIQPKNDANVEADETIILSVFGSTLYTISSTQGSDTAVITNDDGKPQVSVAISGVSTVTEGSGTVTFVFSRTGPVDRVLVVNFDITGTAAFSSDYSLSGTTSSSVTSGSVSFNVGAATANVILSPSADVLTESKETVIFTVSSGSADYDAGTPSSATANINDKAPTLPVISITSVASSVAETVASTTIRIGRSGVLSGVVNVVIGITGTATVKTDYTLTPGVVSGGRLLVTVPSFSSSLSVTFKTINDVLVEGDETAIFTVTPQSSYIVDPSLSSRTITIIDNDFAKRDLHERNALPENSAFLLSSFSSFVMSILSFLFLGFF